MSNQIWYIQGSPDSLIAATVGSEARFVASLPAQLFPRSCKTATALLQLDPSPTFASRRIAKSDPHIASPRLQSHGRQSDRRRRATC